MGHLKKDPRSQALKNSIFSLAMRIQMYQPDVIIACPKKIEPLVQEAIRISGIQCDCHTLSFPSNGHQDEYIEGLTRILGKK